MMKSTWLRISPLLLSLITLSSSAVVVFAHNSGDAALVSRGLRNLGNTCYMNAQLECAFHIPLVRDIILGHDNDNPDVQISGGAKALQNLFIDMEASAAAASAASSRGIRPAVAAPITLCRTLGIPVMEQQDSQEFWKLLLPALKIPTLTDLYQGAYDDYITAVDGSGRERRREEPFLDLSVEVLTHANILDSISDMFGTPELLSETKEGNGWRPEKGAPKVDALKGSLLRVAGLPSLLQLHLKRFQYDYQYDTMSKINSRFAFPAELDLGEVCAGLTEQEEAGAVYDLQSIVVHIGEYGAGHYYSYVRPDIREDVWYRFDDDRVTEVSFQDVVKDAYGGRTVGEEKQQVKRGWFRRLFGGGGGSFGWGGPLSSAYMLQYVKRNEIEKLYCE